MGEGVPALIPQDGAHNYLSRKHLCPAASSSLQLPRRDGGTEMKERGGCGNRKKEDNGMNGGGDRKG